VHLSKIEWSCATISISWQPPTIFVYMHHVCRRLLSRRLPQQAARRRKQLLPVEAAAEHRQPQLKLQASSSLQLQRQLLGRDASALWTACDRPGLAWQICLLQGV
jgi:hypothetical protein